MKRIVSWLRDKAVRAEGLDYQRMLKAAAEKIGELEKELRKAREQNRWIPVEERLPELETPVLITIHQQSDVFARVGWLHESGMWSVPTTRKWLSDTVTHWMPLPEPPGEG